MPVETGKNIIESTGALESSYINIYWNSELKLGIDPDSILIK
jgi:hypothetical protein